MSPSFTLKSMVQTVAVCCLLTLTTGCQSWRAQGLNAEGTTYYMQGNYDLAAQRFFQAMNAEPNYPDTYYNLAVTYHQLGKRTQRKEDIEIAERYYHQCLDRHRDHVDCNRALAVLLVEEGRSQDALTLLDGWTKESPTVADARIELARLSEELNDPDKAKSLLENALLIEPRNSRALAALGRLYEKSGDHQQALTVYERSLMANQHQPALAQRAATLRTALSTSNTLPATITRPDGTRIVNTPGVGLQ